MALVKELYKGFHDRKTLAIRSVVGVGEWLYLKNFYKRGWFRSDVSGPIQSLGL